jgi:type IV secretion system protein VirB6
MSNATLENLSAVGAGMLDSLLQPMAVTSFGDALFYAMISKFIRSEIDSFGFDMMERFSTVVGATALFIITIWVIFQGFRIISGQSRDSMMGLVLNVARVTLIVMAATTIGVAGSKAHKFITEDLQNAIASAVTGNDGTTLANQIDGNLAAMQFALMSIDAINVAQDPTLDDEKKRSMLMSAIGTAGPGMVGGSMLLLYQIALALFVGLGPLFVLCLIFDQTKSLFNRWLMYGISTMFSLAVLSAMVSIATKLVLGVAIAFWTTTTLGALTGLTLNDGMSAIALQQGGVGLLLTLLIMTTPPMAAQFFNGAIGTAQAYSAFSQSGYLKGQPQSSTQSSSGRPGAQPGEQGYRPPVTQGSGSSTGNSVSTQAPQIQVGPAGKSSYGVTEAPQSTGRLGNASSGSPNQGGLSAPQQSPGLRAPQNNERSDI